MFTLITIGVLAAYVYSTLALLIPVEMIPTGFLGHDGSLNVYFEAAAMITVLVLLGQVLELRGPGAHRSWDTPDLGEGSLTITEARRPTSLSYRVEMDGGGQVTFGEFHLEEEGGSVRISWSERGDFGSNPVLAWAALAMRRRHGTALERRLEALEAAAGGGRP
jgi:hypothetical protein